MIKVLKTIFSGFYYAVDFLAYCSVKSEFDRMQAESEERQKRFEGMTKNDKPEEAVEEALADCLILIRQTERLC